uniref:phosphatase PAP2 family protein n=1 Tax=Legionella tunisiensis TaxID=1034944 RepID=UPI00038294DC
IIPLTSAAVTIFNKDYQGATQLALGMGLSVGTTEAIKGIIHETRPNGGCCRSFPSGHVSAAFTGAAFINFRYGFIYSVPLYAGAAYVAYSRVQTNAHHVRDVVAGGVIGVGAAYLSTTKLCSGRLSVTADDKSAGIIYREIFDTT